MTFHPRRWVTLAFIVGALAARAGPVCHAQSVLRGTVTSEQGHPVANAELGLVSLSARSRTDSAGRFLFSDLARGKYTVSVRAIGFVPGRQLVSIAEDGDTVTAAIVLARAAVVLDSLSVRASESEVAGKLAPFHRRRSDGFGRFLDQSALAASEHSTFADVLVKIGGLRLVRRPQRCGGGMAAASGRGSPPSPAEWMTCYGGRPGDPEMAFPVACYLTVFLDGLRYWAPGTNEPPDVNSFSVVSLQAVEVYRGPAELPSELQATASACGALVLWTK